MVRKNGRKLSDQEVVDALVAENAAKTKAAAEAPAPEPEAPPEPNIADRFVQMNALIVHQRTNTRLSEATLAKTLELAFQYHAWQTQWEAQQAQQRGFDPRTMMGIDENSAELVGPTGEYLGATEETPAEDNLVEVNFTPATEEEDTDGS